MKTLFGHIIMNFTSQAENLATEGLNYIISSSVDAKMSISRFLGMIDPELEKTYTSKPRTMGKIIPYRIWWDWMMKVAGYV